MTSAVVVYESPDAVRKDIAALRQQVEEVLPARVDADRFLRVVAKAVIENPKLMQCTRLSLLASIHEAAQLGLEPTGLLGSAYLVPYRMRREVDGQWRTVHEAKLIPGYRGLIDLARRSGDIVAIQAEVWRMKDGFDYEASRQPDPIRHRPFIPDPTSSPEDRDRGPIVGAYMLATLRTGHVQPEVMFYDELEAVRKSSKAADDGPWVTHFSEMSRKTVVRRGSKYLPLTTEFRRALELDEEAEREALPPGPAPAAQVSKATAMLLDRAQTRSAGPGAEAEAEGASSTTEGENGAPGASTAQPSGQKAPESARKGRRRAETTSCDDVNPELGRCAKPPHAEGAHGNAAGVWPRQKASDGDVS